MNTFKTRWELTGRIEREGSLHRRKPSSAILEFDDVDCFGTFRALFGIKADLVTLGKALKSRALDGRMVDKDITVVFSSNEAKTFAVIEPFHSSLCHFVYLLMHKLKSQKELNKRGHKAKSLCGLL